MMMMMMTCYGPSSDTILSTSFYFAIIFQHYPLPVVVKSHSLQSTFCFLPLIFSSSIINAFLSPLHLNTMSSIGEFWSYYFPVESWFFSSDSF